MTIRESYICPKCGKTGNVTSVQNLMEDVRFDTLHCPECNVEWRTYYRTSEVVTEVTFVPQPTEEAPAENETPAPVPAKKSTTSKSEK